MVLQRNKYIMKLAIIILSLLMYGTRSCYRSQNNYNYKVWGYKPVYSNDAQLKMVSYDTPHAVKKAGKIYVYGNYILQNEIGEGIHVIDNSNPATAKRIGFIKMIGSNEISVRNNILYTNSYRDIVAINISSLTQPIEISRTTNAFNVGGFLPEPPENGYYECVDLSKGVVTGWVKDSINQYSCYKY